MSYLVTERGWPAVRASGFLGDQSSGGKATRQNCGRRAENSRPISALLPRTGPKKTTWHSCSSLVGWFGRVKRLRLLGGAGNKTSGRDALLATVSAPAANALVCPR